MVPQQWYKDPHSYHRELVARGYGLSDDPQHWIELALASAECLDCDEARTILERARHRWPDDCEIRCWLAYVMDEEISGEEAHRLAVHFLVDAASHLIDDLWKRAAKTYAITIAVQLGDLPLDEAIRQLKPLAETGDLPRAVE